MDHLNIFNSYNNKSNNHEDVLTRSFLILIKNIPMVQVMFFEMVRKEMLDTVSIDSISFGNLGVQSVYTQISNSNDIFLKEKIEGRTLVSIIISDDKMQCETKIENDSREARYDGVILCNPSWLFIIENKPSKDNIWTRQLNPNIEGDTDVEIIDKPCCLSWRNIVSGLNTLIQNAMVSGVEKSFIEDFIEYVDSEFSWLNPYTNFSVCKNNLYLLEKRCIALMNNLKIKDQNHEVKYHKGWKYYIESGKNTIKQIALDANKNSKDWEINLWLYAGDTMNSAKESFENLDMNKVFELKELGFELSKNFHISYRSSNLLWFKGSLSLEYYLKFWKNNYKNLKQVKRDNFNELFDELEKNQITTPQDRSIINEKIFSKNYPNLNICPGFLIKYSWRSDIAMTLDNSNKFEEDFRKKVELAFSVLGGL